MQALAINLCSLLSVPHIIGSPTEQDAGVFQEALVAAIEAIYEKHYSVGRN